MNASTVLDTIGIITLLIGSYAYYKSSVTKSWGLSLTTNTPYYFNTRFVVAGATQLYNRGELTSSIILAENAYL